MNEEQHNFLKDLLTTASPTGGEMPGQRIWAKYIGQFADEVDNDSYCNTWATLKGSAGEGAPKIMIEAHADEIGFMINHISEEGFVSLIAVGGSDPAITRGRRIVFLGDKGEVEGVIANTAIHLRKDTVGGEKAPKWHEIFVDVGAEKKQEVLDKGLRVGIFAVYDSEPFKLSENRVVSRAIDNKISGYLLARVFEELKANGGNEVNVIALNAVQEEVGGNGAKIATHRLDPDVAIVYDVTHATDTPGVDKKKYGEVKLAGGPSLTHGTANHPLVVERLMNVAKDKDITIQHEAISRFSGTDTDKIFISKDGIPSALVSIPLRYMHSPVETVDLRDVEETIKLTVEFIRSVKATDRFEHQL